MFHIKSATAINYNSNKLPFIIKYSAENHIQQTFNTVVCFALKCKAEAAFLLYENAVCFLQLQQSYFI